MSVSKKNNVKGSGNKPSVANLKVRIASEEYVLGTLSFNTVKQEFSYHFSYPADAPEEHFDCDSGIPDEIGKSCRLPNYKNVPSALTDLLT